MGWVKDLKSHSVLALGEAFDKKCGVVALRREEDALAFGLSETWCPPCLVDVKLRTADFCEPGESADPTTSMPNVVLSMAGRLAGYS